MQVRISKTLAAILGKLARENKRSIPKQLDVILTTLYVKPRK